MSIKVNFYTFSKPKNDVVQPDTVGASFDVVLKEPCSVLNPSFYIKTSTNPVAYNYCYVQAFGRYYFITDWESDHNLWWAHCTVDPLASWKPQILGTTQFVMRSTSDMNEYVSDGKIPLSKDTITTIDTITNGHVNTPPLGNSFSYVIQIANSSSPKINGLQYIVCSRATMLDIIDDILNSNNAFGFGATEALFGLTASVARAIINPLQYVGRAYMLPVKLSDLLHKTSVGTLDVGFWTLSNISDMYAFDCNPENRVYSASYDLDLISNPASFSHGKWLNGYPYTKYGLYAGPFGYIPLDNDVVLEDFSPSTASIPGKVTVKMKIDIDFLGNASLAVTYNNKILAKAYADVSVAIPLTQTKADMFGWCQQAVGVPGNLIRQDGAGAASSTFGCISSIGDTFPQNNFIGQQQSSLQASELWKLQSSYMTPVATITGADGKSITKNVIGCPLCEVKMLSDLSGFCQVDQPHLTGIPCYDEEKIMIADYLRNGIFLGAGGV